MGIVQRLSRGRVKDGEKVVWDDETIETAREIGIDEEAIASGGDFRENQYGVKYWLELDHLIEFEEADQRIDRDEEFWEWFRDYRSKHEIYANGRSGSFVNWQPSKDSWRDNYKDQGKNYLTGWWKGWGYGSHETADTRRLAIALGAIQSVVSVINDTQQKFRVQLASDDTPEAPNSVTQFDERLVIVSPQALKDRSVTDDQGIEVTVGWGLHEASHVKYTTELIPMLRRKPELKPRLIAQHLMNLLEDVRIEAKTSELFPGFESYFTTALDYMWARTKHMAPHSWGPELGDKMNAITATLKWNKEFAPIAQTDPQLSAEFDWFSDWNQRYQDGKMTIRAAVEEAIKHLNEDDQTKQQLQDQSDAEDQASKSWGTLDDDTFKRLLDALRDNLTQKQPQMGGCPSPANTPPSQRVQLTAEQAKQVNRLIQDQYKKQMPSIGDSSGKMPIETIDWTKPQETTQSRAAYVRPGSLVAKMRQAFVFRKVAPAWYERLQRTGDIDENELWRTGGLDLRVMQRLNTVDTPKAQVTLLMDMSGSMLAGNKTQIAQLLANTMLECLKDMKGVTVRVRGHTNTYGDCDIYRIWEKGDPVTRIGMISTLYHGGTPDGLALDACGQEMLENAQPGEDKLIIIVSDGMPNGTSLRHMSGHQYVRHVVEALHQKGIHVVQIAVDKGVPVHYQQGMYRHFIQYPGEAQLPRELTRLLIKLFGGMNQ